MRRLLQPISWTLLAVGLPIGSPALLGAQHAAGAELWRLAAATLPVPPALVTGASGALWNPAQPAGEHGFVAGLDILQTPSVIDASGVLGSVRLRVRPLGHVGILYGRMSIAGLVPTSDSPTPDAGLIPYFSQAVGLLWSRPWGETDVGATLLHHTTQLDLAEARRWTLDVGVRRRVREGLRVALATHFFSEFTADDPKQEFYGALEYRAWRGRWSGTRPAAVWARYGTAVGRGFGADHLAGLGLELDGFAADFLLAREAGYGDVGWRPVGGIRLTIGHYRLSFARDAGVRGIGSAYRVGLEALMR